MKRVLTIILLFFHMICISQMPFSFSDSAVLARLSRDVHILASDSFAGRKSGSDGEHHAYDFISRSFREAGLTAHGSNDASFLQPFPLVTVRIPRDSNRMVVEGWETPLISQYDFSPSAYSSNGQMEGNKYMLIDLSLFREPKQRKQGVKETSIRQVLRHAFQEGNSAVILYNESELNGSETDSLYDRVHLKPEQGLVISVNSDVAAYLLEHPGVNLLIRADVERTSITCHNVIGFIDNGAPYTIIIGAHYDHLGLNKNGRPFNGADDNASGTALMIEMARLLKQKGDRTNNFLFIAFSGEEEGLLGSSYFVKNPSVDIHSINFMVNLDMVGKLGCEGNQVTIFGTGSSPFWHSMYKETPHPEFRLSRLHGVHAFSDHLGFYRSGIPIISLTTGLHYDYHTTRDDAGTINYTGMVGIAKYLQGLLNYASSKGSVGFRKVSGWYNFSVNFKIATAGIDHLLNVGVDE